MSAICKFISMKFTSVDGWSCFGKPCVRDRHLTFRRKKTSRHLLFRKWIVVVEKHVSGMFKSILVIVSLRVNCSLDSLDCICPLNSLSLLFWAQLDSHVFLNKLLDPILHTPTWEVPKGWRPEGRVPIVDSVAVAVSLTIPSVPRNDGVIRSYPKFGGCMTKLNSPAS